MLREGEQLCFHCSWNFCRTDRQMKMELLLLLLLMMMMMMMIHDTDKASDSKYEDEASGEDDCVIMTMILKIIYH